MLTAGIQQITCYSNPAAEWTVPRAPVTLFPIGMGTPEHEDTPQRRRWFISYRASLVIIIPTLVALTGVAISFQWYLSTRDAVTSLASTLFREVSQQAAGQARGQVMRAVPTMELLRQLCRDERVLDDRRVLTRRLLAVMRSHQGLTWVSFSDTEGTFTGVYRNPEGRLQIDHSDIRGDETEHVVYDIRPDGTWEVARYDQDSGYDPRERIFFERARARGERVWIDPYVFFQHNVPGITLAAPALGDGGELLGVFTVDSDLNTLSELVSEIDLSPNGQVFLFTRQGVVLGHPRADAVIRTGDEDDGRLLEMTQIRDDVTRTFYEHAQGITEDLCRERGGLDDSASRQFTMTVDETRYLASLTCFRVDQRLVWLVGAVAPETDFLHDMQRNNLVGLLISLGGVAFAVLIGLLLSNGIARPLLRIASDMERLGRFDLAPREHRQSIFKEIDMMDRVLSAARSGLRSFAAFVPRDVVRRIIDTGDAARLGGQVRPVTVFFSDLTDFTKMAERMEPDALVERLGDYLDELTQLLAEHKGTVDKFMGDGVMAFWGAPEDQPDHATRACVAALRCQQRLAELAGTDAGAWMAETFTRIGAATGEALVGNIGTRHRMNYTVMGDVVNLASRLESLNKQYGTSILVSESTYEPARSRVLARPIDVVAVKGKEEGVKVYEPIALVDEATPEQERVAAQCEAALDAYLSRDFGQACARWEEVLELRPKDRAAALMLDRARRFHREPPDASWVGIYVARQK